ncbi:16S rRNA (adenine(1518)-N(6)/adenine(1519)-N(6))-dimethyltransferase RsmA [Thermococcus thioreducens]|uniref:Probable ribosomal RNA small subunit methyltransferase A n=1 Tax=Thermococcus thioreducens TaxID=277988 RepID=A0A1I0N4M0_9EURY|nr:16S rRNA (adenine(1518)-N(6)/adenine(1519)-N(6))-dimethyltransferase RsmA [Thermococcus thioreducens]ASJ12149.1 16S rRNA methyltransferase [Thermococcus thioreducens]SEV96011.1 dimethyladenosine transferase [Thermococcus thioreducens]
MRERLFSLISKYNLKASSDLGQNFLVVQDIIERNVERAELDEKDRVLEIGPGLGVLTEALSRHAEKVYAIEKDHRLVEILRKEYDWPNVEIIEGDALKVEFPEFNKIVSNLPYQISSPITFRFLRYEFERAVLIYQLEFAQRMVAKPGDRNYSRLSLMIQAKAHAELVEKIGRGAFWPRPKVDSAVVILEPKPPDERIELHENLVRALFQHRRSTALAALKKSHHMLGLSREEFKKVKGAFSGMPHAGKRVFQLSPEEVRDIEEFLRAEGLLK